MRQNGGGSIRTVQYLSSYFFKEDFLLSSIYTRATNETEELWTVEVNGKRLLEVPIFILTSERTFSGGEDFSYTLQNHSRATVIGTPTRGGAHPTRLTQPDRWLSAKSSLCAFYSPGYQKQLGRNRHFA